LGSPSIWETKKDQTLYFDEIMFEEITIKNENRKVSNSKKIMSNVDKKLNTYNDLTRKILNIVLNFQLDENGNIKESISLMRLFCILIEPINSNEKIESIYNEYIVNSKNKITQNFLKILFYLGDATLEVIENNSFGRCVDLDIGSMNYTEKGIFNALKEDFDNYFENKDQNSKVSIMPNENSYLNGCQVLIIL
jgi:hypothetical protein